LTHPPISITPPGAEEAKIALFFNYRQLQQAKQAVADFGGEDRVWDLRQALNVLVQDEEDQYFIFPTEDLIQTFQDQQEAPPEEAAQE